MKTILVPTDFSETANNATAYAVEIAKRMDAKVTLFHVYHHPPLVLELPMEALSIQAIEESAIQRLNNKRLELREKYGPEIGIDFDSGFGSEVHQILRYTEQYKFDMIVMGMHGASAITEKLIGSITTAVIKHAICPVLAIEKNIKFREIKNVVLAYDINQLPSGTTLKPMKKMASIFSSKVYVLNVVDDPILLSENRHKQLVYGLNKSFRNVDFTICESVNDDVSDGINRFIKANKIDMLVMVPQKHGFFEDLFKGSTTKRLAFHTKIPLLTLPQSTKMVHKVIKPIHYEH